MYPSPKFKQNKGSKSSLTIFGEGGTQNLELQFIICKDRYWRCDGPPILHGRDDILSDFISLCNFQDN